MAYGARRGGKGPGEIGLSDVFGLALSGGAGVLAALLTDYNQKGEASALFQINEWVVGAGSALGFGDVPLWAIMLGLIAIGAGSVFYFQPITRPAAFAQGFGLLAAVMTAVPANVAGGLMAPKGDAFVEPAVAAPDADTPVAEATYQIATARIVTVQDDSRQPAYALRLTVNFPNGAPKDFDAALRRGSVRGRLHNEGSKESFDLFRTAGGEVDLKGKVLTILAGVPARADSATLWVRLEVEGYVIEEQSAKAVLGAPLDWSVTMRPSRTPLFVQRLGRSYWF